MQRNSKKAYDKRRKHAKKVLKNPNRTNTSVAVDLDDQTDKPPPKTPQEVFAEATTLRMSTDDCNDGQQLPSQGTKELYIEFIPLSEQTLPEQVTEYNLQVIKLREKLVKS